MAKTTSTPEILNPFTPMAFLPPELAFQAAVASHVFVGSLSVFLWDLLNNIGNDWKLVHNYPIKRPTVVYLVSRWASLAFVLSCAIYETAPVNISCLAFNKVIDWLFTFAVSSTSLLFLIRLVAIFDGDKFVTAFFNLMWLIILVGVLTTTQGVIAANIGPTKYCMNVKMESYVAAAGVVPLINDTLVFLAISWKLMGNSYLGHPSKGGLRGLLRGDYLPAFSKGLLQDGQVYYLTTVTTNLLTAVIFFLNSVPAVYRTMFVVPNVVLMNIMACRVYRRTKFGQYKESANPNGRRAFSTSTSDNIIAVPLSFRVNEPTQYNCRMGRRRGYSEGMVEVMKPVESRIGGVAEDQGRGYVSMSNLSVSV